MAPDRSFTPATSNLRIERLESLVSPRQIREELPMPRGVAEVVLRGREEVQAILAGSDPRLLMVVGPCSIHDTEAALEYAHRLAGLRAALADSLVILMRVYFEKPRTTIGWKGLINDPHLDGTRDMETGLRLARRLLLEVNALGLPVATEMLGPVVPQYVADLVTWTAIGARTVESQTHREMASGLSMPVGFKNSTDGSLQPALDGMLAAATPHAFLGMDDEGRSAIVHTTGNLDRHLVLRGGGGRSNFDSASVDRAAALLAEQGLPDRLMVDCSHGNSNKDHNRQPAVLRNVVGQVVSGSRHVLGAMLESHLEAGNQRLGQGRAGLRFGVSITDACIDWRTTEAALRETYTALQEARIGLDASHARQARRSGT
jgi:3-deoxy-7-phosphoheptulonate synthase